MGLFKEIRELLEGVQTPQQFAVPVLTRIEVVSSVPLEDAMRIQNDFARSCELLQAEDCQAMSVMDDIVAGGPVRQKTLKK